jgi:hypothetical protein
MVERDASRKISVRFGDSSTRFKMKDPKRHPSPKWLPIRVRMEAGRVGGCEQQFLMGRAIKTSLRQQRKPLSRSPQGDAGAGGVPPTPQNRRLPPQEGKPPCAIPQRLIGRFYLTRTGLLMEAMSEAIGVGLGFCSHVLSVLTEFPETLSGLCERFLDSLQQSCFNTGNLQQRNGGELTLHD